MLVPRPISADLTGAQGIRQEQDLLTSILSPQENHYHLRVGSDLSSLAKEENYSICPTLPFLYTVVTPVRKQVASGFSRWQGASLSDLT